MALTEENIRIIIAAELKKQGFKDAENATKRLSTNFKKLGAVIGVALSARAFVNFAKTSVQVFAKEEKAVKQLTTSLGNLGFAYNVRAIEEFLEATEQATLVTKDQLRPAIVNLISTTLDSAKSMEILGTAIDVAAGTGADLNQVTTALTRAFKGNFTSLAKLQRTYTASELEAVGFERALDLLSEQFTGVAAASVDSYSGRLSRLQIAADKAREEVGEGLLKAVEKLGSGDYDRGLQGLVDAGTNIGVAFGFAADAVNRLKTLYDVVTLGFVGRAASDLLGKSNAPRGGTKSPTQLQLVQEEIQRKKDLALQKKIRAEREKIAKLDKASNAARAKALKEEQQLKRAGTIFDMDNIQIVAALQGRISEEQRLRLTALLAINNENADAADKLTSAILALQAPAFAALGVTIKTSDNAKTVIDRLIDAQTRLFLLNSGIANIPKAKNPFEDWDSIMAKILSDIAKISAAIKNIPGLSVGGGGGGCGGGGGAGGGGGGGGDGGAGGGGGGGGDGGGVTIVGGSTITNPGGVVIQFPDGGKGNLGETFTVNGATILAGSGIIQSGVAGDSPNETAARQRIADIFQTIGTFGAGGFDATNVTVNIAGNVMSNDDLMQVITEGLYKVQKRGQSITLQAIGL